MSTHLFKRKQWFFVVFLVISGLMLVSLYKGISDLTGTKDRFEKAEAEVARLEEKRQIIEEQISGSSQEIVKEKVIRDELGLAKPGEIVVILPEDIGETALNSNQNQKDQQIPNWKRWTQVFGWF
jgi:cell division protein FtsB